jgi:hypothetical protein
MCREGLNLQDNYSEVYFTSPYFNPATEDQAIARCWRIGQTKPVYVFRYMMIDPGDNTTTAADTSTAKPCSMDIYSMNIQTRKREYIAKMKTICNM